MTTDTIERWLERWTDGPGRAAAWLGAALALGMLAAPPAWALCGGDPCTVASISTDCDQDGFSDYEECVSGVAAGGLAFPSCRDASSPGDPDCLDPEQRDVFMVWEKAVPSQYDELGISDVEAWAPTTGALTSDGSPGGLGARIHLLPVGTPRQVTPSQKAILVTEDATVPSLPDPTDCSGVGELGETLRASNPNDVSNFIVVYTGRIDRYYDCVYDSAGDTTSDRSVAKRAQVIRTGNHEAGHHTRLAPDFDKRFNGNHTRTGSGCGMDQSSVVKISNKSGVTADIPVDFCAPSQAAHEAGQTDFGNTHCGPSTSTGTCLASE